MQSMIDDLQALSRQFLEIKNSSYRRYFIQTTALQNMIKYGHT
ncbi:MAG TPA: hypothetical protein VLE95_01380 [Chlamydiales bacterium]|nr:hypothetical protein [Chlamydiales bacterium]